MHSSKNDADKAQIRLLDAEWGQAACQKDIDRVVSFYATDGSVVWPDQPAASGHAAIRACWAASYATTPNLWLEFRPTHIEIASAGDFATDFGAVHFAPHAAQGNTQTIGKYVVVWKRENGAWKVLYDCYNMNGVTTPGS